MYHYFLKMYEMQTLTYAFICLKTLSLSIDLAQMYRLNLAIGISDFAIVLFNKTVYFALFYSLCQMPMLVMQQKLIPEHVEATMMAMTAGVINSSRATIPEQMGVIYDHLFIGIKREEDANVSKMKWIIIIPLIFTFWQVWIVRFIPTTKQIAQANIIDEKH